MMPLRSTSMLHSPPTRCIGKGVFAADDTLHGQRLSPSPLMSNDEPCYAARRCRAQPSTLTGTGLREEPAVSSQRRAGMVAPPGMKPQKSLRLYASARFMKTRVFLARALLWEHSSLPPLPNLVTVFQTNSHPLVDADDGRKKYAAHFLPERARTHRSRTACGPRVPMAFSQR